MKKGRIQETKRCQKLEKNEGGRKKNRSKGDAADDE